MKQSIQKIIIAAVLFAAGLSNISAIAQESDGVMHSRNGGSLRTHETECIWRRSRTTIFDCDSGYSC